MKTISVLFLAAATSGFAALPSVGPRLRASRHRQLRRLARYRHQRRLESRCAGRCLRARRMVEALRRSGARRP
ncbi:MAG: hypothetical protein WDM96_18525 [Lacunisphaera sp.]